MAIRELLFGVEGLETFLKVSFRVSGTSLPKTMYFNLWLKILILMPMWERIVLMAKLFDAIIKQRTFIAASPEKVYDTITSAESWDSFFTTGMRLEPVPGGRCGFSWKDWGPDFYTLTVPGEVVEAIRPERFVFRWGNGEKETTVRFELSAQHGGTVITLTEEGYKDTPEGHAAILECASGWGEALTLLKFYIEHGVVYTPPKKIS
jgi:uncharacterized protein YndB with AHSA1/START domain